MAIWLNFQIENCLAMEFTRDFCQARRTHYARLQWLVPAMVAVLAGASLFPGQTWARQRSTAPARVVKEFCRLDAAGFRLNNRNWPQVSRLLTWEEEPNWDNVVIISKYRMTAIRVRETDAWATVRFLTLGRVNGDEALVGKRKYETMTFTLIRTG